MFEVGDLCRVVSSNAYHPLKVGVVKKCKFAGSMRYRVTLYMLDQEMINAHIPNTWFWSFDLLAEAPENLTDEQLRLAAAYRMEGEL